MDRERLFRHLEQRYSTKRDMMARIPLGAQADALWQELLNRRRSSSTVLPIHDRLGRPYWYVTTDKMVVASEKIVETLLENEKEFDPYTETPTVTTLEEVFYTSYVDGSRMTIQEAMSFLQSESPPRDVEELLIVNNRQAGGFASSNLYRPINEDYIKELAYILTEGMDGGGDEYRTADSVDYPAPDGESFAFPTAQAIPDRVRELAAFLADQRAHPLIKSAVAQAWTMVVRPFSEGNERLGRILSSVILVRAGYTFFGEVSLSSLIARKGYGNFDAMANIMREENGGDLTYFLEYYLELLSRAVDERRLRMSKKEEENRVAEQEMAHTPLSAPIATAGRDPEPTVGEVREEEETPTAVGSPESAPEWQELIGTDPPTLPREEQNKSNVERLQEYAEDPETHIGQGANLLLHWLSIGKTTFTCNDIDTALNVNYFKGGSLIAWLKEQGLIELLVNKSKGKVYRIITGDDSPQPQYVECNTACEFLGAKIPVYEAPSPKRTRDDYAPEILEKISSLARSTKSTKDKRLAAMLTSCLEKGEVTLQDYADIGEESKLYTDMLFALQLGIVEKENARCYRILTEVKDGPPALSKSQKRIITEMYESFGDELFSSEMVVATLDYSGAHTSAVLHQFTLMKILDCREGDVYQYQFLINPQDHPECFEKAA